MITKSEYLKALSIVEKYHKQLNLNVKKVQALDSLVDLSNLVEGDYVVRLGNGSKYLTAGKTYKLTHTHITSSGKWVGHVLDDRGKRTGFKNTGRFKKLSK
jgi:hypothetical protein